VSDRTVIRHRRYAPRVIKAGRFLAGEIGADLIPLLEEVDRRCPGLTLRETIGACVLAEAVALEPRGQA
jgi:hypothetical protein